MNKQCGDYAIRCLTEVRNNILKCLEVSYEDQNKLAALQSCADLLEGLRHSIDEEIGELRRELRSQGVHPQRLPAPIGKKLSVEEALKQLCHDEGRDAFIKTPWQIAGVQQWVRLDREFLVRVLSEFPDHDSNCGLEVDGDGDLVFSEVI